MDRFIIREVPTGYKFDLKAANGQTIATSEVYKTAAACRKGIESVRKNAPKAAVEDRTTDDFKTAPNPKFELYQDKTGAFRFRLTSRNGQIIATGEPYSTKAACENGIESIRKNV
jgi:uncharacterized protein YegP (UPF0339 family)